MNGIVDNWTLQNVGELLSAGFSKEKVGVIEVDDDGFDFRGIAECVLQTEALFDILTETILRDSIVVDDAYTYTWESADYPIMALDRDHVLRRKPFLEFEDDFEKLRTYLVCQMCTNDALANAHAANVRSWTESGVAEDQYLSQLLWGGAGMVARSSAFGFPYSPHPLRQRLFLETGLFLDNSSAMDNVQSRIKESRLRLLQSNTSSGRSYALRVLLPPVPAQVIGQASGVSDLFETAIQIRNEYSQFRKQQIVCVQRESSGQAS